MGVHGLWKLVEQAGKPVPLETLENKVLAIDISIWLHQVVKGIQDGRGNALQNAHLIGLFNRLCKLMYFRIKPVFVFDGGVPILKRQTIAKRQQNKNKLETDATRIEQKLLETLAKEKIVQAALGGNAESLLSPSKLRPIRDKPDRDEIFKLPKLEEPLLVNLKTEDDGDNSDDAEEIQEDVKNFYLSNLQQIDVTSAYFKSLPADIRHNILFDMKEARKQSSWGRLHEMPTESNNFSSFQMKRLLKRRKVQECLEEAEQEMGGKSLSFTELEELMAEDGIIDPNEIKKGRKIASDNDTRFLLVKDIKKTLEEAKLPKPALPSTSSSQQSVEAIAVNEDLDLQMAIAMSLEDDPANLTQADVRSTKEIRLSTPQRETLKIGAKASAKSYMQEYGILTTDEISDLFTRKTVAVETETRMSEPDVMEIIDESITIDDSSSPKAEVSQRIDDSQSPTLHGIDDTVSVNQTTDNQIAGTNLTEARVSPVENKTVRQDDDAVSISSDNDSDFVDVPDVDDLNDSFIHPSNFAYPMPDGDFSKEVRIEDVKPVEVLIDPTKITVADDLFADIFQPSASKPLVTGGTKPSVEPPVKNVESVSVKPIEKVPPTTVPPPAVLKKQSSAAKNILDQLNREKEALLTVGLENVLSNDGDDDVEMKAVELGCVNTSPQTLPLPKPDLKPFESPAKNTLESFVFTTTPTKPKQEPVNDSKSTETTPKKTSPKTPDRKIGITPEKIRELNLREQIEEETIKLKDKATSEELNKLRNNLAAEHRQLEKEMNKMDRHGLSITDRMTSECQHLLKLFGVPFIIAKAEAEAQCAYLNEIGLVDAIITDDSDVFLFGGKVIYKNFFDNNKTVLEFRRENIQSIYTMDRHKLIQLALLTGSDYTTGIERVGPVTALEILAAFPSTDVEIGTNEIMSVLSGLRKFRDWCVNGKTAGTKELIELKQKLRGIALIDGFPSRAVVEAYLHPQIDDNNDPFSWGVPDVEAISDFARRKLGWTELKLNEVLGPVLKRMAEKQSQQSIKNYFKVQGISKPNEVVASKRVKRALNKIAGIIDQVEEDEAPPKKKKAVKKVNETEAGNEASPKKTVKVKTTKQKEPKQPKEPKQTKSGESSNQTKPAKLPKKSKSDQPSTSTSGRTTTRRQKQKPIAVESSSSEEIKKVPRIPNPNAPIPQRLKDEQERLTARKKAIEIFNAKKSK